MLSECLFKQPHLNRVVCAFLFFSSILRSSSPRPTAFVVVAFAIIIIIIISFFVYLLVLKVLSYDSFDWSLTTTGLWLWLQGCQINWKRKLSERSSSLNWTERTKMTDYFNELNKVSKTSKGWFLETFLLASLFFAIQLFSYEKFFSTKNFI